MYYKLSSQQEDQLLHQPETGMGYQVVEASKQGNYTKERFLVLNSEIVIDINGSESKYIRTIINEGIFVRLSAFENDRRVDKVEKCLLPGSFTTTMDDYLKCKSTNADPVERYALPNNDDIKFAFHIQPKQSDTLQRGTVQAANEKKGGGKEAYFANGTSSGTFLKQTSY